MGKSPRRLLLCVLLVCIPFCAGAQRKIMMVTEEWAPFRMNDASDPSGFSGIDIDLMRYLEKKLDISIEVQRHPWARALEMMKNGSADLITGFAYSDDRTAFVEYVPTPYYSVKPVFFALKGKGAKIKTYQDLYGKKIGQSKNSAYFEPYNSDADLQKMDLTNEVQILQMLVLGRIDLAIGTDPNISWDIAKEGFRGDLEQTTFRPPQKTDLYLAVSKKSSALDLLPRIDSAINQMLADKTIEKIVSKYR
jgi:polar amino acid transport system substrate-binding protein